MHGESRRGTHTCAICARRGRGWVMSMTDDNLQYNIADEEVDFIINYET